MGKRMHRKKKRDQQVKIIDSNTCNYHTEEDLSDIIASAILKAEERKVKKERAQREEDKKAWFRQIGYPEDDSHLKGWNLFRAQLRALRGVIKIMRLGKKTQGGKFLLDNFLSSLLSFWFLFISAIAWVFAIIFAFFPLFEYICIGKLTIPILGYGLLIILGIILFPIGCIFKIISIEAGEVEDISLKLSLLAGITSVFAIIISAISFARELLK